jgi:hypothetical protein
MIFLRDEETANRWTETEQGHRNAFVLAGAVELAAAFFRPLLD